MSTVRVTLKNTPIKTFPVELHMPNGYTVPARQGSVFSDVKIDDKKVTVLLDDEKYGTLVMFSSRKDTFFSVIPPSAVYRDSNKDIRYVILNDDMPRAGCDNERVDLDRDED